MCAERMAQPNRRKTGFTLVETMVVAALFIVFISAYFLIRTDTGKKDVNASREQEYYDQYARLENQVTRDLRSMASMTRESEALYMIEVMREGKTGGLDYFPIRYEIDRAKKTVKRIEGARTETFDFSKFGAGEEFVFDIEP